MIQTSYFAKHRYLDNGVSIAIFTPPWFNGTRYVQLAPTLGILNTWKRSKQEAIDKIYYEQAYRLHILSRLDAATVVKDLDGKVLLCYEKSGEFCHRHIVANWLKEELGVLVEELV